MLLLNDKIVFHRSPYYVEIATYVLCSLIRYILMRINSLLEPNMCHYLNTKVSRQLKHRNINSIYNHLLNFKKRLRISLNDKRVFHHSLFCVEIVTYEQCNLIQSILAHTNKLLVPNMCHYLNKKVSRQLKHWNMNNIL